MTKHFVCTFLFLFFTCTSYSLEIITNSPHQKRLERFVHSTMKHLPKKVLKKLPISTQIIFNPIGTNKRPSPCTGNSFIYGKRVANQIIINSHLIPTILGGEENSQQFNCKHRNLFKTVKATLLHEIMHLYDRKFLWVKRLSSDRQLRAMGFWKPVSLFGKNYNTHPERSVDHYEYSKEKEFFAVNMEYFLLDKDFKCRRPNIYNFLEKHFKHSPFPSSSCETDYTLDYTSDYVHRSANLSPDRVKEVQFLFASEGTAIMSKWGHSLFKLVVCPEGEDDIQVCRRNIKDHVVVGFLAEVNGIEISLMKGLFGKYRSKLVVSSMKEVKRTYNREEFRNLISLPLKMTTAQKNMFVNHIHRLYWEYRGDYFFLTNNCASEAFKIIRMVYDEQKLYEQNIITPRYLYRYLSAEKYIDTGLLKDLKKAKKQGLYSPSFHFALEKALSKLKQKYYSFDQVKSIKDYIKKSVQKRANIIDNFASELPSKFDIYAALALEEQANFVMKNGLTSKIIGLTANSADSELKDLLRDYVAIKNDVMFPAKVQDSNYGVPLISDHVETLVSSQSEELRELQDEVNILIKERFSRNFVEVDLGKDNREYLLQLTKSTRGS